MNGKITEWNVGGQCAGLWRHLPDITAGFSPPPSQNFLLSGEFPRLDSRKYRILIPLSSQFKNITHLEQCDNSWQHSRSSNSLALLDFELGFQGKGSDGDNSEAGNWNVWFFCVWNQAAIKQKAGVPCLVCWRLHFTQDKWVIHTSAQKSAHKVCQMVPQSLHGLLKINGWISLAPKQDPAISVYFVCPPDTPPKCLTQSGHTRESVCSMKWVCDAFTITQWEKN